MKKKLIKFCEWTTVILAVIGILTLMNVAHEMTHFYEIVKQNDTVISVCFLKLPLDDGTNESFFKRGVGGVIHKDENIESPEWKAVTIGSVVAIILLIIMIYGFWLGQEEENENTKMY